jgi:hypothetical protein
MKLTRRNFLFMDKTIKKLLLDILICLENNEAYIGK